MRGHVIVFCAVLVMAAAAAPAAAGVPATFTDSTGDATFGASDITSVSVADNNVGDVTFTIAASGNLAADGQEFVILVDADRSLSTGQSGFDQAVVIASGTAVRGFWAAENNSWTDADQLAVQSTAGTVSVTIPAGDLVHAYGNLSSFDFAVVSLSGVSAASLTTTGSDYLPDQGVLTYTLTAKPALKAPTVSLNPTVPRAGTFFHADIVAVQLVSGETVDPDSSSCTVRIGTARPVRTCSLLLPKSARGKPMTVSVSVSYRGVSKTWNYRLRVR